MAEGVGPPSPQEATVPAHVSSWAAQPLMTPLRVFRPHVIAGRVTTAASPGREPGYPQEAAAGIVAAHVRVTSSGFESPPERPHPGLPPGRHPQAARSAPSAGRANPSTT